MPAVIRSAAARGGVLLRGGGRPALLLAGVIVLLAAGGFYVRGRWPGLVGVHEPLTESAFHVTPQPDWISCDVRSEVFRDAALDEIDAFDPAAVRLVSDAFAAHTWVAEVKQVRKSAGPAFDVAVAYRRPAAMVEVTSGGRPGLLPVDEEGVLLPPEEFQDLSPDDVRCFPRIAADQAFPAGPVGTSWGDPRITGAARIAALLREQWPALDLYRILGYSEASGGAPSFELHSKEGGRVIWGAAPGAGKDAEPSPKQKLDRLKRQLAGGPLPADRVIDLRQ